MNTTKMGKFKVSNLKRFSKILDAFYYDTLGYTGPSVKISIVGPEQPIKQKQTRSKQVK